MIRRYQEKDREILKEITAICFDGVSIDQNIEGMFGTIGGKSWQWRKLRHIDADIAANPDGIFVAEEQGQVIGYITVRIDHESKIGWIPHMAVMPQYQGQGIGKRLLEKALEYMKDEEMELARIETLEQNEIGKKFYPKMGFREVARQIYYAMPLK
ncbi:MAG: hypothetical protein DRH10_06010 [Deltaproteobacteria bacterium]|nr:MAG: hypothetical protein DRQ12_10245 [candidate division KSB1 bacterium]RLB89410.1 MAG: hypothetical protein DRH10_06010 [Deltaproteobacteria bacterium]